MGIDVDDLEARLTARLAALAREGDELAVASDLWASGRRRQRRRAAFASVAVVVGLLMVSIGIGWGPLRPSPPAPLAPDTAPMKLPSRIQTHLGALPMASEDRPPGPLSTVFWTTTHQWFGSHRALVGITGGEGRYVELPVPGKYPDGLSPSISADGRWVAAWIHGSVAEPPKDQPTPIVGIWPYDTLTGQARTFRHPTRHGLAVDSEFGFGHSADPAVLAFAFGQSGRTEWAAPGEYDASEGSGYWVWEAGQAQPHPKSWNIGTWVSPQLALTDDGSLDQFTSGQVAERVDVGGEGWYFAGRTNKTWPMALAADGQRAVVMLGDSTPAPLSLLRLKGTGQHARFVGDVVPHSPRVLGFLGWRDSQHVVALYSSRRGEARDLVVSINVRTGQMRRLRDFKAGLVFASHAWRAPLADLPLPERGLNENLPVLAKFLALIGAVVTLLVWLKRRRFPR